MNDQAGISRAVTKFLFALLYHTITKKRLPTATGTWRSMTRLLLGYTRRTRAN